MAGRRPLPKEIKEAKGTFREDRHKYETVNVPKALTLETPTELNDWGLKLWNVISEDFLRIGLVGRVDAGSLFALCNEFGTYCHADSLIKERGLEIDEDIYTTKGELCGTRKVPNPLLKTRNEAFKNYNSMCSKFGITPVDRVRLSAPKEDKQDDFSEFD